MCSYLKAPQMFDGVDRQGWWPHTITKKNQNWDWQLYVLVGEPHFSHQHASQTLLATETSHGIHTLSSLPPLSHTCKESLPPFSHQAHPLLWTHKACLPSTTSPFLSPCSRPNRASLMDFSSLLWNCPMDSHTSSILKNLQPLGCLALARSFLLRRNCLILQEDQQHFTNNANNPFRMYSLWIALKT